MVMCSLTLSRSWRRPSACWRIGGANPLIGCRLQLRTVPGGCLPCMRGKHGACGHILKALASSIRCAASPRRVPRVLRSVHCSARCARCLVRGWPRRLAVFWNCPFTWSSFKAVRGDAPAWALRLVERYAHLAEALQEKNAHIHGDCKVNNLLFDAAASRVDAIIDLDTAMWGHWAWDLGDLARSVFFSRGGIQPHWFRELAGRVCAPSAAVQRT